MQRQRHLLFLGCLLVSITVKDSEMMGSQIYTFFFLNPQILDVFKQCCCRRSDLV